MKIKFFGCEAGFGNFHTSASFSPEDNELVVIDCPVSTYQKLKKEDLKKYENIYVLITHTHGDHIGGLGLFLQYVFFVLQKKITVVAPSSEVKKDIETVLRIEGNETSWYKIITADDLYEKNWFKNCILTKHSPQLENKCFGYCFNVDGTNVVYTGDTSTLAPFVPYITSESELYVDTSVYYGQIHLKLSDALHNLIYFTKMGVNVYLMHLDDIDAAKKIISSIPGIEVVTI